MSDLEIAGETVLPGECRFLELPVARLPTQTSISLPIAVVRGTSPGACLWLSAAIHGDEINGVEIIRQVLERVRSQTLEGTLIAVPIVNVFGFIQQSRYLSDRRDLNRSFPGSAEGSLASRLAHSFMSEIVSRCTHGIDLHTASDHRINLPQIRANLEDEETCRCARAFGAPVMMHAATRDGSLRQAAAKRGIPILVYEGGEALRFDPQGIGYGVEGIIRVMVALKMLPQSSATAGDDSLQVLQTRWVRASRSGILRLSVALGDRVFKRQELGAIADTFGNHPFIVRASLDGLVIGHTQNPLVNQGDAIVHLAAAS